MYLDDVRQILIDILSLDPHGPAMDAHTRLLGSIPELDSMAVVNVLTALEEHFGIVVEDDEINAATFDTLGSLADFVAHKLG
jgi:acyl carrier protein